MGTVRAGLCGGFKHRSSTKRGISLRVRKLRESRKRLKVNDLAGQSLEDRGRGGWRVVDTAEALFPWMDLFLF